jgi:uncharacterized protein (TIGR03086 family)
VNIALAHHPLGERKAVTAVATDSDETVIDLQGVSQAIAVLVGGIESTQLALSTPCTAYSVADIVDHLDHVALLFAAIAIGDLDTVGAIATNPGTAHTHPQWSEEVPRHLGALGVAWARPSAWIGTTDIAGADLPNPLWGRIVLTELVVHGWDIATATGSSLHLPEEALLPCLDHVIAFVPNAPVPGLWGPSLEASPEATVLEQILAITGRSA